MQIIPNPFTNQLNIQFILKGETGTETDMQLFIQSIDGKYQEMIYGGTNPVGEIQNIRFDAAHLPNGMYIFSIRTKDEVISQKGIKF